MKPRDVEAIRARLEAESRCRVCKSDKGVQVHHIVPRRTTKNDDTDNLVPLCHICHQQVHDRKMDLLSHLTPSEQAKAVLLLHSIESARMWLCPSAYRVAA